MTLGRFRINAGSQTLYRYSPALCAAHEMGGLDADYQIAAFASGELRDERGRALARLSCAIAVGPLDASEV